MGAGVGVIRTLRTAAIATALLLAAGNAWALGLGQIQAAHHADGGVGDDAALNL